MDNISTQETPISSSNGQLPQNRERLDSYNIQRPVAGLTNKKEHFTMQQKTYKSVDVANGDQDSQMFTENQSLQFNDEVDDEDDEVSEYSAGGKKIIKKTKTIKKADKIQSNTSNRNQIQDSNDVQDDLINCGICEDPRNCTCGLNGSNGNFNSNANQSINSMSLAQRKRQTHYLKIDDNMRRTIVFEVMVMKESLKNVCDRYGVNFSSAKNVIQIYRKEGRLEKKIQKSRKPGQRRGEGNSDMGSEYDDDDEDVQYDEDGVRMVTMAPEALRCKLNLYVKPIEEEDTQSSNSQISGHIQKQQAAPTAYFQMNLEQLLQASPELNMDLRTQFQLQTMSQNLSDKVVKIPKNENFALQIAPYGYAVNLSEDEKAYLNMLHEKCQKELAQFHHLYKNPSVGKTDKVQGIQQEVNLLNGSTQNLSNNKSFTIPTLSHQNSNANVLNVQSFRS